MKIQMNCSKCFHDGVEKDKGKTVPYVSTYPYWEYHVTELDSWDNYYEFNCDKLIFIEILKGQLYESNKSRENLLNQQQLSLGDKNKIEILELEIKETQEEK